MVYSHIPKTAGTTLNYILQGNFGSDLLSAKYRKGVNKAVYRYEDLSKDIRLYPNLKCITGHCIKPFVSFKEFESRFIWVTILREPKSRFISHYIHQQANPDPQYKMDLVSWGKNFNRGNWMVKMIAGEEDVLAAIQIMEEKFSFIGFTEHFYDSLFLLKECLELERFEVVKTTSKMTTKDASLKKQLYSQINVYEEFINESNALDIELYNHFYNKFRYHLESPKGNLEFSFSNADAAFKKNLFFYKLKNNLIYKPSVALENKG